ncbi:MAG TPA: hypothetical protein VMS56_10385 [Thermoanaerobaculia bacterium]|nr:hypothetical protein [Thermoanaerobaculia bacterium]
MLAAVPGSEAEFHKMVILVAVTGLLAFGVSAGILTAFWKSLRREDAEGAARFTSRSAMLLVALIAALLLFSLLFAGLSYL